MNRKVKKRQVEYHPTAVIILVVMGLFSYVYIGSVLFTALQTMQFLGAAVSN